MKKHPVFRQFFLLIGLVVFLYACGREIEILAKPSTDYYPMETGKYKIYQIDSIVYDEYNCAVDTVTFQIKEVTGDTVWDGEDALAYKVERHYRADNSQSWLLTGVWIEKLENYQIQRVEENQRIIKLVFPIKETKYWDGIVYIRRDTLVPLRGGAIDMFKDWDDFTYQEIDVSFVNPITADYYEETVLVNQVDKTNNIERRYSRERYAKGIGLVYKEMKILDSQCRRPGGVKTCDGVGNIADCIFLPWEEKAEKGFILTQTLIEHNY